MLRRLAATQPDDFAFTPANQKWAEAQITKFPEGRQASAIIPLLWRAQEQEGWLSRPAIEHISEMLGLAHIRGLEVATFYFMFQLQPVGSVSNIQICGTTSCMICGAEDLVSVCQAKIAAKPHTLSADGKFSWEEVECLGACANAPMAQIGKDYYEDLTAERLGEIIDELAAGKVPVPGPQNGRYAAEPLAGLTSLKDHAVGRAQYNASVQRAVDLGETVKRIDGTEELFRAPWQGGAAQEIPRKSAEERGEGVTRAEAEPLETARPAEGSVAPAPKTTPAPRPTPTPEVTPGSGTASPGSKPQMLIEARGGAADDLKKIKGVGSKLEALLHRLGVFHFDQVAGWSDGEIAWVDDNLEGFKGRVVRDNWVSQAKILADGRETDFSARAK